jgi:hypothetical protein
VRGGRDVVADLADAEGLLELGHGGLLGGREHVAVGEDHRAVLRVARRIVGELGVGQRRARALDVGVERDAFALQRRLPRGGDRVVRRRGGEQDLEIDALPWPRVRGARRRRGHGGREQAGERDDQDSA